MKLSRKSGSLYDKANHCFLARQHRRKYMKMPTVNEIAKNLGLATQQYLTSITKDTGYSFKVSLQNMKVIWMMYFQIPNVNLNEIINKKVLWDPLHPITKKLVKVYSLETFVYTMINKGSKKCLDEYVPSLGHYAISLCIACRGSE